MFQKYKYYFLFIFLLLVAAVILVSKYTYTTLKNSDSKFSVSNIKKVEKVRLSNHLGDTLLLTKKEQGWLVNNLYEANEDPLGLLLNALSKTETRSPVPDKGIEVVVRELLAKHFKCEVWNGNEKPEKVFYIGGPTSDSKGTFMLMEVDGQPAERPYITYIPGFEGYLSGRFKTDLTDWRTRIIFKNSADNVQSLSVTYPQEMQNSFQIERNEKDSFLFYDANHELKEQPKQRYIKQYLDFYQKLSLMGYENEYMLKDSVLRQDKICVIHLKDTKGKEQEATLYYMPLNERSFKKFDEQGRQLLYDVDHYFATINNGQDFVSLYFKQWANVMRTKDEFFKKKSN